MIAGLKFNMVIQYIREKRNDLRLVSENDAGGIIFLTSSTAYLANAENMLFFGIMPLAIDSRTTSLKEIPLRSQNAISARSFSLIRMAAAVSKSTSSIRSFMWITSRKSGLIVRGAIV